VCFNARRDVDVDKGIRTDACEAAKIKPHLRVVVAASTTTAAPAALQKLAKFSTGHNRVDIFAMRHGHDYLEARGSAGTEYRTW
jgi:hypothetical protein